MGLPELPDVWAPVGTADLPKGLLDALSRSDWKVVRQELSKVMDGAITDGPLGRELLQFVMALPPQVDPVFDRYRSAAMLDHGDWDGLRESLTPELIEPLEISGKADILMAPVDRSRLPDTDKLHHRQLFEVTEYIARNASGPFRRWVLRIAGINPTALWSRQDIPIGRHIRYRHLHDCALLAVGEAKAGRLSAAHALSTEALRLGDEQEPLRATIADLAELARLGMGDRTEFELLTHARICERTGPSPLGSAELCLYILPLLGLRRDESLAWASRLVAYVAARLAFPRWQLQADSWLVASQLQSGAAGNKTELAALIARSRRATAGLRALPTFLDGYAHRRLEAFNEATRFALRSGNLWLAISALTWSVALDPQRHRAKRLRILLDATDWRRPVLVPSEVAADAALGMTSVGERSEAVLEVALTADRPNVTTEVVRRYLDDAETPQQLRLAAVDALARVGTTHAREILSRLSQRRDDIGKAAASAQQRPGVGLSEREIEVLSLAADGLTNKQIGEKLFLSHHTIARHLANARAKLGASNRAEAAVRLHRAGVD